MSRRRSSLRVRLTAAIVAVSAVALVVAAVVGVVLIRRNAVDRAAERVTNEADAFEARAAQLRGDLAQLQNRRATGAPVTRIVAQLTEIRAAAAIADARVVFVDDTGRVFEGRDIPTIERYLEARPEAAPVFTLPTGVTIADLDGKDLAAGSSVRWRAGDMMWLTRPFAPIGRARGQAVLVIGEAIDTDAARRAAFALTIAGLVALVLGGVVALWLARRMTKPLAAIELTAQRIAAGDLTARVPPDPRADAETAALAATLDRVASDLDLARTAERTFLQSVSHDLRTPLTAIRGWAEALQDGTVGADDVERRRHAAEVITSEAARLERLVGDLLELSRLETHAFTLVPRIDDAATTVRATAAGFLPKAQDLGLELTIEAPGAIPADLDHERLGQIVANLVENALKVARSSVVVAISAESDTVTVTVRDDGPGIAPADAERVFERGYRAEADRSRAIGTGLGLAIVHELARAMGGTAALAATGPSGTELRVSVRRGRPPG